MKKLDKIMFVYDDGTAESIEDSRACMLFQSRCNSAGILAGLEDYVVPLVESKNENITKK